MQTHLARPVSAELTTHNQSGRITKKKRLSVLKGLCHNKSKPEKEFAN
jgi:hypothetical protein